MSFWSTIGKLALLDYICRQFSNHQAPVQPNHPADNHDSFNFRAPFNSDPEAYEAPDDMDGFDPLDDMNNFDNFLNGF